MVMSDLSRVCIAGVFVVCTLAARAAAQPAGGGPGRVEVSAGAGWSSGYGLGSSRVTLPPQGGASGVTLFEAEATILGGPAAAARFGWRFWRMLSLEGGVALSRAQLRSTVQSDVEPALNASLDTPFHQLAAEAGLVVPLPRVAFAGGRAVPFVTGGGGYLRQTYEDGVLLETGRLGYGGGGVRLSFGEPRPDRFVKRFGLRADVRLVVRTGGIDVEDRARPFLTLTGGAFVRF
jgi:hypothetical protein